MSSFLSDYDSFFKKYPPVWSSDWNKEYIAWDLQNSVMIRKELLAETISIINEIWVNISNPRSENLVKMWDDIHNKVIILNSNFFINWSKVKEEMLDKFTDSIENLKYPSLFNQLLWYDFSQHLLKSFEQTYCLNNSDAILIMIEYLKFLTICKIYGENFSPSTWVDQFWHHHMSFDSK